MWVGGVWVGGIFIVEFAEVLIDAWRRAPVTVLGELEALCFGK